MERINVETAQNIVVAFDPTLRVLNLGIILPPEGTQNKGLVDSNGKMVWDVVACLRNVAKQGGAIIGLDPEVFGVEGLVLECTLKVAPPKAEKAKKPEQVVKQDPRMAAVLKSFGF
jgi:hypothetical protein